MAEPDDGEYELKDEELVDFEGSDYGFGSDEELELEDEEDVALPIETEEEVVPALNDLSVLEKVEQETEVKKGGAETEPAPGVAAAPANVETERREGAESGEIEEDREEKDDGVVAQPVPNLNSVPYRGGYHHEGGRVRESRRRHRKADLEDGELDDAAMPDGSDHEAEGNADDDDEDDKDRRGRKRRKDRFAAERHSEDRDRKDRELGSVMSGPGRQHRNRGSDRHMDRSASLSKASNAVGRGMMPMGGFAHNPNMAPGIMGPGGPLVPLDVGPGMLHPMGRAFMGPLGGMPLPGGVSMSQFQEAMAVHEHMMRSHRMMQQFAQAAAGPGRPMNGPMGGPGVRPMMGLEFGGPLPRGMLHMQPQGPDMAAQMNFAGPMDAYPRSPRTSYGSGRAGAAAGGMYGQGPGRVGSTPRNGVGRQGSWSAASAPAADLHPVGRGRVHGRGQVVPPAWVDSQGIAMAQVPAGQAGVAQGVAQNVNIGHAMGPGTAGSRSTKAHRGPRVSTAEMNQNPREGFSNIKRTDPDGTWKIDGNRSSSNGVQNARTGSNNRSSSSSGTGNKRDRENGREKHPSSNNSNSHSASVLAQGNGTNTASNLIQLAGPVQKSRFLTVSGLPENTSMSVVVEAFEKQGKVMDFRKEEKGDAFTITFASIPEAISAKRHMHRSIVAGHQITVEYAVQRTEA
ncbi:unnamed protein product [Calypogeia fissa]